jgi:hypothetical protein
MEDEEINDVQIINDEGINMPWTYIFFTLHKHCNLSKNQILEYTLPQVIELMEEANKYVQFEVSSRMPIMPMLGGAPDSQGGESEDGFKEANEDDINDFARFLGGM